MIFFPPFISESLGTFYVAILYQQMATIATELVPTKYSCELCDYNTSRYSQYSRHLNTAKHITQAKNSKTELLVPNDSSVFICSQCKKIYKERTGLWRHKKTCEYKDDVKHTINASTIDASENDISYLTQLVLEIVKSNNELHKQNNDLQQKVLDICKNGTTVINNNNNTLNKNKTFNLQFFLNEQCKDAMNLMDFVKSVSLQLSDLENVTKLGYVDGIAGIIMQKLNEMDVYKRPIHCSDAKREILYVREDGIWEKESTDHTKLRKAIKGISKKNRILLNEWSESHPEANDTHNSQNLEYMLMIVQAMGGKGELIDNENKIMKKIMKNVLIDKV